MITVATNADEAARLLRQEMRAFKRAQRVQMRRAANVVKDAVVARLSSGSPLNVSGRAQRRGKPGRGRARGKAVGPLFRSIRVKIRDRGEFGVAGFIRPAMRGFYGRFHELGLDATAETRAVVDKRRGRAERIVKRSHRFHLPPRPYLEPTARAKRDQVVAMLGDSFNVFHGGVLVSGLDA